MEDFSYHPGLVCFIGVMVGFGAAAIFIAVYLKIYPAAKPPQPLRPSIWHIQKEHRAWSNANFDTSDPAHAILGAQEELGELSHHYLKREQGIRTNEDHEAGMKDAVGDITLYLMDFCNRMEYDYEYLVVSTWDDVKRRDWIANRQDGIAK